ELGGGVDRRADHRVSGDEIHVSPPYDLRRDERPERHPGRRAGAPHEDEDAGRRRRHEGDDGLEITVLVVGPVPGADRDLDTGDERPEPRRPLEEREARKREGEERSEDRHRAVEPLPVVGDEREVEEREERVADAAEAAGRPPELATITVL